MEQSRFEYRRLTTVRVDTDVLVIALYACWDLKVTELWVKTSKTEFDLNWEKFQPKTAIIENFMIFLYFMDLSTQNSCEMLQIPKQMNSLINNCPPIQDVLL